MSAAVGAGLAGALPACVAALLPGPVAMVACASLGALVVAVVLLAGKGGEIQMPKVWAFSATVIAFAIKVWMISGVIKGAMPVCSSHCVVNASSVILWMFAVASFAPKLVESVCRSIEGLHLRFQLVAEGLVGCSPPRG